MFVGHLAVGLALKRVEPRLNLGVLVFGAEFADILFFVLVLAGVEQILPPVQSGAARFYSFDFPWSHGLLASLAWALLAGALACLLPRFRAVVPAAVLALAVLSHVVLDFLVHIPDLPLATSESPKIGLGLWQYMPAALALELAITGAAVALFLRGVPMPRGRRWQVLAAVLVAAALTVVGPYVPGEPPGPAMMAASSLATLILIVAVAAAADAKGSRHAGR